MASTAAIDVEAVRADTPACRDQAYLDGAGSSLAPTVVLDTVITHLRREQEVGGYVAQFEAQDRINATLETLGRLVGVAGSAIALQTSATAAWMRGLAAIPFEPGDRLLITKAEYASNVLPMLALVKRRGVTVEVIPNGPDATTSPTALAEMLDEHVKLVAITHMPSHNGLIVDVAGIGAALREAGSSAWYLIDACQSVGQLPIDMPAIGCDLLTATGRKWLRGPRGTGFLALSSRALRALEPEAPDMYGSTWHGGLDYSSNDDASRFQSFEMSYAEVLGLGAACDYALALGIPAIRSRINSLALALREMLSIIPDVRVLDRGTQQSGIVVFACPGDDAIAKAWQLQRLGITLTAVTASTNPAEYDDYGSHCVLRASPHIYNTSDDLARLVSALRASE